MTHDSSNSERIADALRETRPDLDEVSCARMERAFLVSATDGAATRVPNRGFSTRQFAAGVGLGFAAAAALFLLWRPDAPQPTTPAPLALYPVPVSPAPRLERWANGGRTEVSAIREGHAVVTQAEERARLSLGRTQIELSPGSLLVPERLASDVRLRLERGEIRVEFNPEHPGEEGMLVETLAARVEVVGTAFRVRVSADGSTDVSVEHGVVRVTTLPFGDARELRAGESLHVAPRSARQSARQSEEFAIGPPAESAEPIAHRARADGVSRVAAQVATPAPQVATLVPEPMDPLDPDASPVEAATEDPPESSAVPGARPSGPPLDADASFALASRLTERHLYAAARHELYAIVRRGRPVECARAWSLVADTRERERDWPGAGEAYRRAAEASPQSGFGHRALFALARLRDVRLHDQEGARSAYRAYLRGNGQAPLAVQARHALCRLGDLVQCAAGEEPVEAPPRAP